MPDRKKVIQALEACSSSGLFCAGERCPYNSHALMCKYYLMRDALELLRGVPAADVVPAPVRCSDCRFYDKRDGGAPGGTGWCSRPGAGCGVPEAFFCAGAERKEEERQ